MDRNMKLTFRFPTLEENQECAETYDEVFSAAKKLGIMTKKEMMDYLDESQLFTKAMQDRLEEIESLPVIKYPEVKEFKNKEDEQKFLERTMVEIIRGQRTIGLVELLDNPEETDETLKLYKKSTIFKNEYIKHTCEGLAESARMRKLTYFCTYSGDKKYWKSHEQFNNQKNKLFVTLVSIKVADFLNGFNSTVLRKMARHPTWRTRWIAATKTGCPLFHGIISEWDVNKTMLIYFSHMYDNIYAMYEPPENFILENDSLLDAYLESKNSKNSQTTSTDGDKFVFKNNIKKKKVRL